MPIIHRKNKWLFLAEGYTGSRACCEALLKLPGTELVDGHHGTWPHLKYSGLVEVQEFTTYSFVRHPCDIIATQVAKGSRHTVPTWLMRRYRRHDPFFCHRPQVTMFYEGGLKANLEEMTQSPIKLDHLFPTPGKVPWRDQFTEDDFWFARATIPELYTLGYVDWTLRKPVKPERLEAYLQKHEEA